MSETVAVIGAGSTGSSTAYHLAKSGFRVVLLDRGEIGYGMTSRSTAVVRTHYSNDIVARMALYSLKILRDFSSIGVSGFTNCGMLVLVPESFRKSVEQNVKMLRRAGINEIELTKSEARSMFPDLDLEECDYFAFEPDSGYADPVATAGAYAARARELGTEILLRNEVEKLEFEGGNVSSLRLQDGTRIKCGKVILCTNVWTNHLLERSGVPEDRLLPIRAVPHPVVVYRRPSGYQGKRTIVSDYFNKAYFKPEGQSLLFGGSIDASIDNQSVDPDNPPGDVPFEYVSNYSETISKRIPAMKEAEFHSSYIGMYDITPDEHPIIDDLSTLGLGGVYSCVGLSGHGFKLCPAFGVMNTEMVIGKELSDLTFDRSHFALSRFRTGKLLSTRYEGLGSIG
jgi:sarcosine oxidase, subunit beta